ncbi:hypothetical protein [Bacteroides fragilis]|uniref:hypothetical protein n=1 Tax=Bacteroides fragilis TaxID=817 RepID=UPI001C6FDD09|nr:hypothetical protein [Bacteroides fragilis]MBW9277438.1 hypothetical protein [Bacteroides fragilis]
MTLIAENQEVKVYQHNTVGGQINVYQFRNGELTFGAEKVSVLNRFERTQVYKRICKVLTYNN